MVGHQVYVQRDYSRGTTPSFQTALPAALTGKVRLPCPPGCRTLAQRTISPPLPFAQISEDEFKRAVGAINALYIEAETPSFHLYFTVRSPSSIFCLHGGLVCTRIVLLLRANGKES